MRFVPQHILCGLESVKAWLKAQLDLEVNEDESGAGPSGDSQLLGFRIHESGDVSASPQALVRLKARVRQLWDARQSLTSEELRAQWQRYITGWWNYFGYANWRWRVKALSGWVRRHMRKCFWLRWYNRQGRRNALCKLGVSGRRLGVAGCRRGAWPMSRHVVVQQALKPVLSLSKGRRRSTDTVSLYRGSLRVKPAGLNRRMRKTACPVVWEG